MKNQMNIKTGSLPTNFVALGIIFIAVGAWRLVVSDWFGIPLVIIALLLLLIKSGVIIDAEQKRIKKYVGYFGLKKGEWVDISSLINLQIAKTKASQRMNVLSISRIETKEFYKLFLVLSNKRIEILKGDKEYIMTKAKEISSFLGSPLN